MLVRNKSKSLVDETKQQQNAARVKRCEDRRKNGLGSWRVSDLSVVDMEIFLEDNGLLACGVEHSKSDIEKALRKYLYLAINPPA